MKLFISALLCFLLLTLTGCTSTWNHPDPLRNNESEFMQDKYDCQSDAMQRTDNLGYSGNPLIMRDFINECMRVKYGWVKN